MQNGFLVEKDDWFGEWAETNSDNEALPKIDQERDEWNYKSGYPMISCDIGDVYVTQALCDSGADTSIMSLELFNAIDDSTMTPTDTWIQLANSTLYQPEGVIDYMPIKIHDVYIAVDFLVVKTCGKNDIPLILGRPFLWTTNAHIMWGETIQLAFDRRNMSFDFHPTIEECSFIIKETSPQKQKKRKAPKQVWKVKQSGDSNSDSLARD